MRISLMTSSRLGIARVADRAPVLADLRGQVCRRRGPATAAPGWHSGPPPGSTFAPDRIEQLLGPGRALAKQLDCHGPQLGLQSIVVCQHDVGHPGRIEARQRRSAARRSSTGCESASDKQRLDTAFKRFVVACDQRVQCLHAPLGRRSLSESSIARRPSRRPDLAKWRPAGRRRRRARFQGPRRQVPRHDRVQARTHLGHVRLWIVRDFAALPSSCARHFDNVA